MVWYFELIGRRQIRLETDFLNVRCGLKQHLHKIEIMTDNAYRICFTEDETAEHYLRMFLLSAAIFVYGFSLPYS